LTVSSKYYEEPPDWDLVKTVDPRAEVHFTRALPVFKPRLIGDIGLRGFYFLYRRAKEIIRSREIDFIWIPVPSFYTALLGRWLYEKFQIPYGIDYIDPWIRDIHNRRNLRSVLSLWLARMLEPVAVKKASLITGVAFEYYRPVLERNFKRSRKPEAQSSPHSLKLRWSKKLEGQQPASGFRLPAFSIPHLAFPYGFDLNDYQVVPSDTELLWDPEKILPVVYAGAFLPNARIVMEFLFQALQRMKAESRIVEKIKFYFIGTGSYAGETIRQMSERYGIEELIEEKRERFPYLKVLYLLKNAHGVLVVGSTEPHYTASKIYQALLSLRPVMTLLHEQSQAYEVLKDTRSEAFSVGFDQLDDLLIPRIQKKLGIFFSKEREWDLDLVKLNKFSAHESAGKLVRTMEEIIGSKEEKKFIGRKNLMAAKK
jgi:hypothetical protein